MTMRIVCIAAIGCLVVGDVLYENATADQCGCEKKCYLFEGVGFRNDGGLINCLMFDPHEALCDTWVTNGVGYGGTCVQATLGLTYDLWLVPSCQLYCQACSTNDFQLSDPRDPEDEMTGWVLFLEDRQRHACELGG